MHGDHDNRQYVERFHGIFGSLDHLQKFLRSLKVAVHLFTNKLLAIVAEYGKRDAVVCMFQKNKFENPLHQRLGILLKHQNASKSHVNHHQNRRYY